MIARACTWLVLFAALSACVRMNVPQNTSGDLYDPEKSAVTDKTPRGELTFSSQQCAAPGTPKFLAASRNRRGGLRPMPPMRYSPGDRINVLVIDSPEFSGNYAINVDGTVNMPFMGQLRAAGLTNQQLQGRIQRAIVDKGLLSQQAGQVSVQPVQYAPINVTVAGAVFHPGRYTINKVRERERLDKAPAKSGDNPIDRFLPSALMAAGGVRPDADLSNVIIRRYGQSIRVNWRGAITGESVDNYPLIEGDHIEVTEAGCFQSALVRTSQITPDAIRIFTSNQTAPIYSASSSVTINAGSAGNMPYGSRLLQGLVYMNCVGGTYATNARRFAVLISRNPKTGRTEVVQRSVEDLVRSPDRDTINPFLMPGDAIACYDSDVAQYRDVMKIVYESLLPGLETRRLILGR